MSCWGDDVIRPADMPRSLITAPGVEPEPLTVFLRTRDSRDGVNLWRMQWRLISSRENRINTLPVSLQLTY